MHPFIIDYKELELPAYFFWMAIGFIFATNIVVKEAIRSGENVRRILDLCIIIIISSLVGARLGHIIFENPGLYLRKPLYIFYIWHGGLVFYGGVLFSFLTSYIFVRYHKISFLKYGDIFAPAIMLGLSFGRIGCLSAGCCYGKPIDFPTGHALPWGILFFRGQVPEELRGIFLHPTQIYSSLNAIFIFLFLSHFRKRQTFHGQVFLLMLILYGITRSVIEVFRFDLDRGVYFGGILSTSQGISAILVLIAVVSYILLSKKAQKEVRNENKTV